MSGPVPSVTNGLAVKLASLCVHVAEARGPGGHPYDWVSIDALLADTELQGGGWGGSGPLQPVPPHRQQPRAEPWPKKTHRHD